MGEPVKMDVWAVLRGARRQRDRAMDALREIADAEEPWHTCYHSETAREALAEIESARRSDQEEDDEE